MIANRNESRNFNAVSNIGDKTAMYMTASYSTKGDLTFNQSIRDLELYKSEKATVDADYEEWKQEVTKAILGE